MGRSGFLPHFLLCSEWINATSFWSLLFSLWLFIYPFQLHPSEQKPCRMATDSHVEYLFLPNLSVFSHCCHLMSLCKAESSPPWKGWGVSWVSDPHRRTALLVKKKKKWEPGMDEPKGGRKVKGGEGSPLPGPRHLGWQSHLGFRRLLSKRGKEGLFFTWAWNNRGFVSLGGGVTLGLWRDTEWGIKPWTHLHKGWGGGNRQPIGTGQMLKRGWFISFSVLGGIWPPSQI